jgi:hypothetical protein
MMDNLMDTKLIVSSAFGIVLAAIIVGSWKSIRLISRRFSEWRIDRAQSHWPIIDYKNGVSIAWKKTPLLMRAGLHPSYLCKKIFKRFIRISILTLLFFSAIEFIY